MTEFIFAQTLMSATWPTVVNRIATTPLEDSNVPVTQASISAQIDGLVMV